MDLHDPDLWQKTSDELARLLNLPDWPGPYPYDLADESHRLDVVQLVCQALDRATDPLDCDEEAT